MYYKRNYMSCMLYVFRYVLRVILNSIDKFRKTIKVDINRYLFILNILVVEVIVFEINRKE